MLLYKYIFFVFKALKQYKKATLPRKKLNFPKKLGKISLDQKIPSRLGPGKNNFAVLTCILLCGMVSYYA
jgi:hypothetical protein